MVTAMQCTAATEAIDAVLALADTKAQPPGEFVRKHPLVLRCGLLMQQ
jgi:hypothetical protein